MKLPIIFGTDVYCRAGSKLLLAYDDQKLYIGYTAAGDDTDRNYAAKITALNGNEEVPYTCSVSDNKIVLSAEEGYLEFAIGGADEVVVSGQGLGIVISNGKAKNMFMGGGNAVIDARGGGLFAIAGVKLRFITRSGYMKPASRWNFNYLCDPDPRLYLYPDENKKIEFVVFASEEEKNVTDNGLTIDTAADELVRDFYDFCDSFNVNKNDLTAVRAAWTVWNCAQPKRRAYELELDCDPVYIRGRQSSASLFAEDYALYALLLGDPEEAVRVMFKPFAAIQQDGFIPSMISNHKLIFTPTPPLYGVVLEARDDISVLLGLKEYSLLKRALDWWRAKRYCENHNLFYYLHRVENGRKKPVPYISNAPVMAPELNTYMLLWIRQMEILAERLNIAEDIVQWKDLFAKVSEGMEKYLLAPDGYVYKDVLGNSVQDHTVVPHLLKLPDEFCEATLAEIQRENCAAEYLAMYGSTDNGRLMAERVLKMIAGNSIPDVRTAVSCLLASKVLSEGR